jgi:NADH dehydrogenase/NADH:ubiquinone oxidoreductase subunit G
MVSSTAVTAEKGGPLDAGADAKGAADAQGGNAELASSTESIEKDDALALVGEHAQEIDSVVEARVLKKIDYFLMPAMVVGMAP